MWHNKKVAVILPSYREKHSIGQAIKEFSKANYVDEVIVVDNNAEKGTSEIVHKTNAKLVKEPNQGYGHAIRKGLASTQCDLLIVAEPDGSFDGKDVIKLLAYSDDFDMVFGSRTHLPLIRSGSDMNFIKRIGDVMLGKLVTVLFLCNPLTDLGCTLRLTTKKSWKRIEKECQASDYIFATEWVLVAAKNKIKFMEIPINYRARIGKSTSADSLVEKIIHWGLRKFVYIWKVWSYGLLGKRLYKS